jgi:hypothetical protein
MFAPGAGTEVASATAYRYSSVSPWRSPRATLRAFIRAKAIIWRLQEQGDPWRLSEELPDQTGEGFFSTPPMFRKEQ